MAKKAVTISPEQEAKALVGYQMAVSMWASEGSINAGRFNVMLIANAILLAILAAILTSSSSNPVAPLVMSVVGIVLSGVWYLLSKRSFEQQDYYKDSAQEIEEAALADSIVTLTRGKSFASGGEVSITIDGKAEPSQLSTLAVLFSAETNALLVIALFGAAYTLLTLLTVVQMVRGMIYY